MSASTIALMRILFFTIVLQNGQEVFSTTVICARRFYPIDNACKLCPAHCNVCTNATQCSLCQMGYYGPICQNTCEIGCSGTCHKLYGHCTYGCPDGKYADDKSPACLNCSSQCKLCRSLKSCVECNSGYYGYTCMKRCSEHCKAGLCNSTDGACFECKKGYYKMDKECVLCPDGCAHCNDSHMCTVCNSAFIGPIHGKCLLDCPTMNGDEQESICHQGLCQNLPAYWKLPPHACNQAHPSDCVTEGLCVVLKSRQLTLERTSSDNQDNSLIYMHFKCSLECIEHATLNLTDPCKGHVCKDICVLEKPLYTYAVANFYTIEDTPPLGTSINSHCTLEIIPIGCNDGVNYVQEYLSNVEYNRTFLIMRGNHRLVKRKHMVVIVFVFILCVAIYLLDQCLIFCRRCLCIIRRARGGCRVIRQRTLSRLPSMEPNLCQNGTSRDNTGLVLPNKAIAVSVVLSLLGICIVIVALVVLRKKNHELWLWISRWRGFTLKANSRKGQSNEDTEADDITGNVSEDIYAAELNVGIRHEIEDAEQTRFMYK